MVNNHSKFLRAVLEKMHFFFVKKDVCHMGPQLFDKPVKIIYILNWVSKYYLNQYGPKRGMAEETKKL